MRGVRLFTILLGSLLTGTSAFGLPLLADGGKDQFGQSSKIVAGSTDSVCTKDLSSVYQVQVYKRRSIAGKLDDLWTQEHEISAERERLGRAGDMVSVTRLERDLLAVRKEIDRLRSELTKVNRVIALIDNQAGGKR